MPKNPFSHIDLYIPSFETALPFYEARLPELRFTRTFHTPTWKVFAAEGELPSATYFAMAENTYEHCSTNKRKDNDDHHISRRG